MSVVTAGDLDKRVTVIRPVGTTSGTGGIVDGAPETVVENWPVAIEPVAVNALVAEALKGGQVTNIVTSVVRSRYHPSLAVSNRVLYVDARRAVTRTFEVLALVNPAEGNRELHLLCAERVT